MTYVLLIWYVSIATAYHQGIYPTADACREAAKAVQQEYAVENLTTVQPVHTLCLPQADPRMDHVKPEKRAEKK